MDKNIKLIQEKLEREKEFNKKIQQEFDFLVPDYIIEDLFDGEYYAHICLMINIAYLNGRLTEKNVTTLKNKIKEIFYIKNSYDRAIIDKNIKD